MQFRKMLASIKTILPLFLMLVSLFCSIHSFVSIFVSSDFESFRSAVENEKTALVENRMIIGLKNDLAKKTIDTSEFKKISVNGPITSYGVGLNNEKSSFFVEKTKITPIQSNLLRYDNSIFPERRFLIQYIPIYYVQNEVDFDDENYNIIISSHLFEQNNSSNTLLIKTSFTEEPIKCNVIAYYNEGSSENVVPRKVAEMFYHVYEEPVFFNNSSFDAIFAGQEDYKQNIQNDIIFSTTSIYTAVFGDVFSNRNWEKSFVKYRLFEKVYDAMDEFNKKSITNFVVVGAIALFAFICEIAIITAIKKDFWISIVKYCQPLMFLLLIFAALFTVLFVGKTLSFKPLFFASSFGVCVSISLAISLLYVLVFYINKNLEKKKENEQGAKE